MECACFDPVGDCGGDDVAVLHKKTTRKAIKRHTCYECDRQIEPGEWYELVNIKWKFEGFDVVKTCLDCKSIQDAFFCSYFYGGLFEMLEQYLEDYDPKDDCYAEAILKLTERAKEKVQEIFERLEEEE